MMTWLHPITPCYKDFKTYRIPDKNGSILSLDIYFTTKPSKPSHQEDDLLPDGHALGEKTNLMPTTDGIAM